MSRWSWISFLARSAPRPVLVIGGLVSVLAGAGCVVALMNQGIAFQWDFSTEFEVVRRRRSGSEPSIIHYSFGQVFTFGLVIAAIALTLGLTSVVASIRLAPKRWRLGRHSA